MRVMVIVKATEDSEAGTLPDPKLFEAMGRFNEELVDAGILLAGDGLKATSHGKRIVFDGTTRTALNGPFAPPAEQIAGFWLWQVKDMDDAVTWVKRCPNPMPGPSQIEIRPLYEISDFAGVLTDETKERRERLSEKLEGEMGPAGAFGGLGS